MSAKEMFEKLEYEINDNYSERFNCICYQRDQKTGYERIQFDLESKKVKIYFMTFRYVADPKRIDLEELQAINKQIEELGWK